MKIFDSIPIKGWSFSVFKKENISPFEKLFEILAKGKFLDFVKLNLNIVRGLAYYSGNCWETNLNFKAKNAKGKDTEGYRKGFIELVGKASNLYK